MGKKEKKETTQAPTYGKNHNQWQTHMLKLTH
jgi:hypothetical protein